MTLQITRLADATPIHPPDHTNVQPVQLQGGDHSPTEDVTVILSHYLPGARAEADTMRSETVYVVVAGELFISSDGDETTLNIYDSVRLPIGVTRVLENRSPLPTSILVIRSTRTATG